MGQVRARRGDIQGLRAVGALLVAIFHIWIGRVSGGVDVFFVVSGYLILGSLLRKSAAGIDLLGFGVGLMKRLLPASFFVIVVVAASAPFWLPSSRWEDTIRQATASTLYVENWYLAFNAVDYLARDSVPGPLQHFWAMSAQVQALVLCASVLAAVSLVARRAGGPRTAAAASVVALSVIFVGSLAFSIVATEHDQPFTYFSSLARLWEFALGGLVAWLSTRLSLPETVRIAMGWAGLALVLSCGVVLNVSAAFPGYVALWPTLGAGMVLLSGASGTGGVARLLSHPVFLWIGDRSYALYLWHWPLLIFYLTVFYLSKATLVGGLAVFVVSIVFADLTYRLVERLGERVRSPLTAVGLSAAMVSLIGGGIGVWNTTVDSRRDRERDVRIDPADYPGAQHVYTARSDRRSIRPGPLTAGYDLPAGYGRRCDQSLTGDAVRTCFYGPAQARKTLVIVGGSHATHWLPALRVISQKTPFRIIQMTKSSCQFSASVEGANDAERTSCEVWNRNVMRELERLKPDVVFTTATRANVSEHVDPGFFVQWRTLAQMGIHVLGVRDTPWMGFDVSRCVEINGRDSNKCFVDRSRVLARINPATEIPLPRNVSLVDLTDRFCSATTCFPVAGNMMIYSDKHHMTATYSRTLAPDLERPVLDALAGSDTAAAASRARRY